MWRGCGGVVGRGVAVCRLLRRLAFALADCNNPCSVSIVSQARESIEGAYLLRKAKFPTDGRNVCFLHYHVPDIMIQGTFKKTNVPENAIEGTQLP